MQVAHYLGCVGYTGFIERILRCGEAKTLYSSDIACVSHASPAYNAIANVQTTVPRISEVDDIVKGEGRLAEDRYAKQQVQHCLFARELKSSEELKAVRGLEEKVWYLVMFLLPRLSKQSTTCSDRSGVVIRQGLCADR